MSGPRDDEFGDLFMQLIEICEGEGSNGEIHRRMRRRLVEAAAARGGRFATDQVLIALLQRSQSARRYWAATAVFADHCSAFLAAARVADGPPPDGFHGAAPAEDTNVVFFPGLPT